jgi:hypothetical protein
MAADDTNSVEHTGRSWATWAAFNWMLGIGLTVLITWVVTWWIKDQWFPFWNFPAWLLYSVLFGIASVLFVVRLWATAILFGGRTPSTAAGRPGPDTPPPPPLDGTVICCSGGGVKSAAFCLGALQALQRFKIYQNARKVVGVSGGGYMASAFAARGISLQRDGQIFDPKGNDVGRLRSRTNYLASSSSVVFDLVASVLWGFFVNALIVGSAVFLLMWLVVRQARLVGLVVAETDVENPTDADLALLDADNNVKDVDWTLIDGAWKLLLLPAIPIAVAITWFIVRRWRSGPSETTPQLESDVLSTPGVHKMLRDRTPNVLFTVGFITLLFYPGAPYLATVLHNMLREFPGWGVVLTAIAGLGGFFGFVATVFTVLKQTRQPQKPGTEQNVLGFYRTKIAPRIGVTIAFLALYFGAILLTQHYLAHDVSLNLTLIIAGVLALFAIIFGTANKTSLFEFYRDRLSYAYLPSDHGTTSTRQTAGRARRFLMTSLPAKPELVLCATANLRDGDLLPSGRNGTPFIFSRSCVGYTDTGLPGGHQLIPPGTFSIGGRAGERGADLATAMAISGAAVAPLAGRQDKVWGANRVLLTVANVRQGVWVHNPYWTAWAGWRERHSKSADDSKTAEKTAKPPRRRVPRVEDGQAAATPVNPEPAEATTLDPPATTSTVGKWIRALVRGGFKVTRTVVRWIVKIVRVSVLWVVLFLDDYIPWISRRVLSLDDKLHRIPPVQIIKEALGTPSIHGCCVYLTDGGHYDNLGLVEGLRSRPKTLILIDGSGDPEDEFPAMGDAIATARIDLRIEIDFDPTPLQRKDRAHPDFAWTTAWATYPDNGGTCEIQYLKCLLPAGLTWDLQSYQLRNPNFPATSQKYEMYDEFDFEAFRQLGYLLARGAEECGWRARGSTTKRVNRLSPAPRTASE